MLNKLTDSLDFHGQALSLRSERQRLLASNIANADTPGYVARDMDFARALREATGQLQPGSVSGGLSVSTPGHMAMPGGARSASNFDYSLSSQTNLDSNTVDMDRERANFADNSVRYEATLRFINSNVKTTLDAIKGQ